MIEVHIDLFCRPFDSREGQNAYYRLLIYAISTKCTEYYAFEGEVSSMKIRSI